MPIYEYRCAKCAFQKEFLQRLSDAPLTKCPECNKRTFKKMVTAAGFQLKGTGWYATDFKNSGSKAKPKDKAADGPAREGASKDTPAKEAPAKESSKSDPSGGATATPASS